MLRSVVGDQAFFAAICCVAIHAYLEAHRHANATTGDLQAAFEEVTGEDLDWFFEQWTRKSGHPEYEVRRTYRPEEGKLALSVRQVQRVEGSTPLFRMPVDVQTLVVRSRRAACSAHHRRGARDELVDAAHGVALPAGKKRTSGTSAVRAGVPDTPAPPRLSASR